MGLLFYSDMQRIQSIKHHNSTTTEIRHYFHDLGLEIVRDMINDTSYFVYYENVQGHLINMIVKPYQTSTSTALSADGEGFHYVYTDHLGSILSITDDVGAIVAEQKFDPWGRKRNPITWEYDSVPAVPFWLIRGFTAHEHLEEFQLIHMNGRLYDPNTGTMLSPDNGAYPERSEWVQNPFNTQSYNRYAYAFNNPLKYSDPSGESVIHTAAAIYVIFFTDRGYEAQKYVSPVAVKGNVNLNSQGLTLGVDASVGAPQSMPIHAREQAGVSYHFGDDYNGYEGWEGRYGYEVGITGVKTSYTYYDFEGGKFDQATNQLTIGGPRINFKYENDFMFGLPADGGDRYRTAAARFSIGHFNVGFNFYTGDPRLKVKDRNPLPDLTGQLTYMLNDAGDDPDEFRSGVAYFGIGGMRLGRNSERIRNSIQNDFAHDTAFGWTSGGEKLPHFAIDKSKKPEWYWNFGSGSGNTLW